MNSIIAEQIKLAKISATSAYQSLVQIETVAIELLSDTVFTVWDAYDRAYTILTSEAAQKRYRILHAIGKRSALLSKELAIISGMILIATWASIQEWAAIEVNKHLDTEPSGALCLPAIETVVEAVVEPIIQVIEEELATDPWVQTEVEFVLSSTPVPQQIPTQNPCLCLPSAFDRYRLMELAAKSGMKVKKNTSTKVLRTKLQKIC